MQVKKPDFKIFAGGAEDGELHDFPDVARGWGVTKLQTNKKPPLSWMNGAFNRVDNNFYYLLQNGLVEWTSEIEYSANALTQLNGVIYRAKEASKGESPAASSKWEKLFADKVGTSDFIGMSQSAIKKELDKKVSAADLTQTVTTDKQKAPSNFAVDEALKSVMLELGSVTPVGSMIWTISPKQPKGRWLKMNGAEVSRSAYKELFDEIGTLYGKGDELTTFNLPDARGYFPRFWDDGRGIDAGRSFGSFQEDAMQKISATAGKISFSSDYTTAGAFKVTSNNSLVHSANNQRSIYGVLSLDSSLVTRTAEESRPKNISLVAWIKY